MGELDNAPIPPMDAEPNGMEDPMNGTDPNAMGDTAPMGDDMGADQSSMGGSDDDELMNIVNGMSTEKKAAVIKYAKSMSDDSEGEMPMESKRNFKSIIDETINDVLDKKDGTKRPEKKMPRQYKAMKSPFKSPF